MTGIDTRLFIRVVCDEWEQNEIKGWINCTPTRSKVQDVVEQFTQKEEDEYGYVSYESGFIIPENVFHKLYDDIQQAIKQERLVETEAWYFYRKKARCLTYKLTLAFYLAWCAKRGIKK